tara:strand:- start:122 stop:532 length:411 start_codon:yes stop_codon:yes gene_type:complete
VDIIFHSLTGELMITLYEIMNVHLSEEYTKARKKHLVNTMELEKDLFNQAIEAIDAMDIPEDDERHHWIQKFGITAGIDLLTLGKVQPENMLAMRGLGEDFPEAVKVATSTARKLNQSTIDAEKDLNEELIPNTTI